MSFEWPADGSGEVDLVAGRSPLRSLRLLRALERSQHWSHAHMDVWQRRRVAQVLAHAGAHIAMYERIPEGVDDVDGLPVTDGGHYRQRPTVERLAGPAPSASRRNETSGSSGLSLTAVYPPNTHRLHSALMLRTDRARGIPFVARRTTIAYRPHAVGWRGLGRLQQRRFVTLPMELSAGELAARLQELRPAVLSGYAHLLVEVGEAGAGGLRPRWVTTNGEHLGPVLRKAIRRLLGASPLDTYGAGEVGPLAWQCAAGDLYHVNHELVLLELLDADLQRVGPGESGDVVVTTLANPLMPLIRYAVGDGATWADRPCACGHALPALASIGGRTLEWLQGGSGPVAPERLYLDTIVDFDDMVRFVRRYRVHQDADGAVAVSIAVQPGSDGLPPRLVETIRRRYEEVLGPGIDVAVRRDDDLRREPSGKYRMVSSERAPVPR